MAHFNLPTELLISTKQIENWDNLTFEEREEALGEYVTNQYGFLHNGFTYEHVDDKIQITDIDWETDEEDN